ncbi:MFS general substrate transporter [Armillaria novae-zelandiae]|uniref:MFS general substrate transporter n=1 Tax=Armillaria novae-zelandiae TaxID=153914 RepID=A0AA39U863_9AGAR|nr:MFS general substrate transporter [Armillaria novae-zelandiae]
MSPEKDSSSSPTKTSLAKDGERSKHIEASKDVAVQVIDSLCGETTLPPPPTLTEEQEKKLWRKVDLRLMPILSLMYLFSFLDRAFTFLFVLIGNARLQGLTTQLHLDGNKFNIALVGATPYCILECPANLVLEKFRPSRWLPGITVVWGIVMTLMGLVKNYHQFVGARVCLGAAEAGLFPGVVYYLTLWYPRHQLQVRIGYFFGAASLAGAFSGLLAFAISFMSGTRGLLGWSWIFIIEGSATVAVGLLSFFILVDFPATAKFLTPEERAFVVWKKNYENSSVGEEEHFSVQHIIQALTDWQVLLHIPIYMSIVGPLYGITFFLPFGHTPAISQLLTVPPYIFTAIVLFLFARYSDRLKMRSPFIYLGLGMLLVGFTINVSNAAPGVKYFGTFFCVAGSYASLPGAVAWLGNNLAGQYKRGVGMATQIGIGGFAGAIASNIYRTQDSPRFILGHALELMFVGIGFVCVPIAVVRYKWINANREKEMQRGMDYSHEELKRMGDRAPDFRYMI